MSLKDFALGVLASILAAIICGVSKYIYSNLKGFLVMAKALAYAGKSKTFLFFNSYQIFFLARTKLDGSSLGRKTFRSPIFLSLVICISLMVFTPYTANRNEEYNVAVYAPKRGVVHVFAGKDGKLIAEGDYPLTYQSERGSIRAAYRTDGLGRGTVSVGATNVRGTLRGGEYSLTYSSY